MAVRAHAHRGSDVGRSSRPKTSSRKVEARRTKEVKDNPGRRMSAEVDGTVGASRTRRARPPRERATPASPRAGIEPFKAGSAPHRERAGFRASIGPDERTESSGSGTEHQVAAVSPNLGKVPGEDYKNRVPPRKGVPGGNDGLPRFPGTDDNMPGDGPNAPPLDRVPGSDGKMPGVDRPTATRPPGGDIPIGYKPEKPTKPHIPAPKPREEPGGNDNDRPTKDPTKDPDYSDKITDKDTPSQPAKPSKPDKPNNQDDGESSAEAREDREQETRDPTDDPGYSDNISGKDTPSW